MQLSIPVLNCPYSSSVDGVLLDAGSLSVLAPWSLSSWYVQYQGKSSKRRGLVGCSCQGHCLGMRTFCNPDLLWELTNPLSILRTLLTCCLVVALEVALAVASAHSSASTNTRSRAGNSARSSALSSVSSSPRSSADSSASSSASSSARADVVDFGLILAIFGSIRLFWTKRKCSGQNSNHAP